MFVIIAIWEVMLIEVYSHVHGGYVSSGYWFMQHQTSGSCSLRQSGQGINTADL